MSAVAASPDALDDLAGRFRRQAVAHDDLVAPLRRAVADLPVASAGAGPVLAPVIARAGALTSTIDELVGSIEDLGRFVTDVSDALRRADDTLARVGRDGGTGTSPWTTLGTPSGSSRQRIYARGVRRTGTITTAGPLRRGARTRDVTIGQGSVRDGWGTPSLDVSLFDLTRRRTAGVGAATRLGTGAAHVDLDVFAGAAATGQAFAGAGDGEAHAGVRGSIEAGAHARAAAFAGSGMFGVGGAARVFAGARASGEARVGVGKTGIDAHVDAHALVGGAAEAEGEVDLLGIRTTGHAGVSYGLGGELEADAHLGLDEVSVHFDVGATVGLGVSLGFDVSVSPRAVVGGLAGALGGGASAIGSGASKLKRWFS